MVGRRTLPHNCQLKMFAARSRHLRDRGDLCVAAAHRDPGGVRRPPDRQTGAVTQQVVLYLLMSHIYSGVVRHTYI